MIRINRPVDTNANISKPQSRKASNRAFKVDDGGGSDPAAVNEPSKSEMLGALIALQGGEHAPQHDIVEWSNETLDVLEELRNGLLQGSFDKAALKNLADHIDQAIDTPTDPVLADLQEQIILRAKVELAKIERDAQTRSN